jgi:voltage-gated potassium channel Kch
MQHVNKRISGFRERWHDQLLTIITILITVMLFVAAPLQASGVNLIHLFGFFLAIAIVVNVFVMSESLFAVIFLLIAVGMAGTATVIRLKTPSTFDIYLLAGSWLIMGIMLGWVVARGKVTYHRILGAILLYLVIGMTFASLFTFVGLIFPNSFLRLSFEDNISLPSNLIYFSFVTLTTTGYGDIVPVLPLARSLCNLASIIGQLYPATLLARLVSLEVTSRR